MTSNVFDLTLPSDDQVRDQDISRSSTMTNDRIASNINQVLNVTNDFKRYTVAELEHNLLCCEALMTYAALNTFDVSLFSENSSTFKVLRDSGHDEEEIKQNKQFYFPVLNDFDVKTIMYDISKVLKFLIRYKMGYFENFDINTIFAYYHVNNFQRINFAIKDMTLTDMQVNDQVDAVFYLDVDNSYWLKTLLKKCANFSKTGEEKRLILKTYINEHLKFKFAFRYNISSFKIPEVSNK
ncbi:p28 [Diodia vein chlorosis virus]|uniref:p28 n=1 Tax=Diodia vein chlorosis virus TaxID=656520 RepID=E7BKK4_9CLOS|nr:p28 [Diodia vein chlorosis virus]ADU25040.1 p28 [Diodia vein chlorosis virus]